MTIFMKCAQTDAVGTSNASRESIGEIKLNKEARRILYILLNAVGSATKTTAEALGGSFHMGSEDLGIPDVELRSDFGLGGASATNIGANHVVPKIVDYKVPNGLVTPAKVQNLDNARLNFYYEAALPEPTEDAAAQACVVYDDGKTPTWFIKMIPWLFFLDLGDWFGYASDADIGDAVSEQMAETFTIPNWVRYITQFSSMLVPDAVATAGEFILGYADLSVSVPGIDPLEVPLPAIDTSLGTADNEHLSKPVRVPLFIDKGNNQETITPTATILGTSSGANALYAQLSGMASQPMMPRLVA